jgi:hypothetical protein
MKKFLFLLPFLAAGFGAFCLSLSCSTKAPSTPNNFQTAVSIISGINPTLTFTPTATFTFTPTITLTFTPTITSTPYVTATIIPWTGLKNPTGIAVDGNGFVYVADAGTSQVGKYTSNGVLVVNWGNGGVKGKISVTDNPVGLAFNSGNDLYVIGSETAGVSEFGLTGALTPFTTATFSNPKGIGVDGGGNIYVSDATNNRIVQLTSTGGPGSGFANGGIFNLSVPVTVGSVILTAPATLSGLAVSGNTVYVTTQGANVISGPATYSGLVAIDIPSGSVTAIIPGFNNPSGVAFDPSGNLWVADTGNKQIVEFQAGMFNQVPIANFNDGGLLQSPVGVAVDASGNIYVTDSVLKQVIKFTP